MTQTEINRTRSLNFRRRLADLFTQVQFVVFTTVVLCLLALGYLWHRMFVMVPPGFLGVMYRTIDGGVGRTERGRMVVLNPAYTIVE